MALATFKDFCIDASDARRLGAFWAVALGRRLEENGGTDMVLRGADPARTVWINQVPEPKTVKNRVHLDVHTGDLAALTAAGATILNDTDFRWVVMADPDGQEFCAFVRDAPPEDLLYEIAVDCADPEAAAGWWGQVFGVPVTSQDKGEWFSLERVPGAPFESLTFVGVPEPKTAKNRIHWDVKGSTEALVAAGARLLRPATEDPEPDRRWDVLADPEGNEFCAFER
ncbi:MAG TPA: VOC family protein [Acidimicrobiia bacterium]|nr:VOC family protein [Acidimicrobiia bacterium]